MTPPDDLFQAIEMAEQVPAVESYWQDYGLDIEVEYGTSTPPPHSPTG